MLKLFQYAIPGLVLAAGICLTPKDSAANVDYTKMTGKKCVYCHIGDWTSGKFTDAGIYFREHHTLKGYVPPAKGYVPPAPPKEKTAAKV